MVTRFYLTALNVEPIAKFRTEEDTEKFFKSYTEEAKYLFKYDTMEFVRDAQTADDYASMYHDRILSLAEMCEYPGLEMERFGISCDYSTNPETLSLDMTRMLGKEELMEAFKRIYPSHISGAAAKISGPKFILPYFVKMGKVNMGYAECTLEDADILIDKCNYVNRNRKNRYRIKESLPIGDCEGKPDYRTELYGSEYLKEVEMFHDAMVNVRNGMHVGDRYLYCFVKFN